MSEALGYYYLNECIFSVKQSRLAATTYENPFNSLNRLSDLCYKPQTNLPLETCRYSLSFDFTVIYCRLIKYQWKRIPKNVTHSFLTINGISAYDSSALKYRNAFDSHSYTQNVLFVDVVIACQLHLLLHNCGSFM